MKKHELHAAIVAGFSGKPSLLAPNRVSEVVGWLLAEDSAAASESVADDLTALELCAAAFNVTYNPDKPFVFADGLAYIPVYGTLINRFNYYSSWYNVTGYRYIRSMFDAALADPDVRGIVFDVNSPGGQVYGCFELAEHIRDKRGEKPSIAVVDSVACSAAYAISSAAGKMVASPSSDVGSIGVICVHFDLSDYYKKLGIKVTPIMAGEHKFDGNPYEPLPDEVRKDLQAGVDKTYAEFVSLVAANRGLEEQAIRDTEARVYDADEALELGLIDELATANDAIAAFHTELSGSNNPNRSFFMSNDNAGAAADANAVEQATKNATTAATQRIEGILNHAEAAERGDLAKHLAFKTQMSVEEAAALLAVSPKAAAKVEQPAGTNAFAAAMSKDNPQVGSGGAGDGAKAEDDTPEKRAAAIVADFQKATGFKPVVAA
jgi:signal peptide peptidase SppA